MRCKWIQEYYERMYIRFRETCLVICKERLIVIVQSVLYVFKSSSFYNLYFPMSEQVYRYVFCLLNDWSNLS